MNFSGLSQNSILGRLARLPLRLLPPNLVVPVLQGSLRGKRWIVGSGVHGYWLGSYELAKRRRFEQLVRPGQVVYDIGAHVGYYSLLAACLVGPAGRVLAFEPNPRNLAYLHRHIQINAIHNVTVVEAAISSYTGQADLAPGPDSSMGRLAVPGAESVPVRALTLDSVLLKDGYPPPQVIKIDVEGSELEVLRGAQQTLLQYYPTLFLATHSRELRVACCDWLQTAGYRLQVIDSPDEWLAVKS